MGSPRRADSIRVSVHERDDTHRAHDQHADDERLSRFSSLRLRLRLPRILTINTPEETTTRSTRQLRRRRRAAANTSPMADCTPSSPDATPLAAAAPPCDSTGRSTRSSRWFATSPNHSTFSFSAPKPPPPPTPTPPPPPPTDDDDEFVALCSSSASPSAPSSYRSFRSRQCCCCFHRLLLFLLLRLQTVYP